MKFYELTFEKDASEMSEEDMMEVITEFKDKNGDNLEAFESLKANFEEVKEQLDGRVSRLAEKIADEQSLLSEEELMEYSLERLEEMAESIEFESEEPEPDGEGDDGADFMKEDKPSRAGDFSEDSMEDAREAAKAKVSRVPGLVIEE